MAIPAEYDFANILFAGRCNRTCPFCIGKELPAERNQENLNIFPPRNINSFITEIQRLNIREIVFTGTTTDPQIYRYERELLSMLRKEIPLARISLHTNGALVLRKIEIFNSYDRACLSFPSFNPETYFRMMGSRNVPNLEKIAALAKIPIKVSCVINEHNIGEIESFLENLRRIGIKRAVLRRLYGETRSWNVLKGNKPSVFFRGNPVYDISGMEVTYWDFDRASCRSINLFPDGTIGGEYLLSRNNPALPTPQVRT